MIKTTMKIMEKRGFSNHDAALFVHADPEGVKELSIHGPKGCTIMLPYDDVIAAGMAFYKEVKNDETETC